MIVIPDQYRVGNNDSGKRLNKENFAPQSLSTAERRRVRKVLSRVTLTHQIAGEQIPSLIDESYNCAVILFLRIDLTDIKHKDFINKTLQPLMKPHAVFHLTDPLGHQAFSFAHKRLNKTDSENIVIADHYCTDAFTAEPPQHFPHLTFEELVNRNNKRDIYLEAMTKAYIHNHPKLFLGAEALFDSTLWYHGDSIHQLYRQLTTLCALKTEKAKASSHAQKSAINTKISSCITDIKKFLIPPSHSSS